MAQLAAKGKLNVGDEFEHESIIGSLFKGRVEAAVKIAEKVGALFKHVLAFKLRTAT